MFSLIILFLLFAYITAVLIKKDICSVDGILNAPKAIYNSIKNFLNTQPKDKE